MSPEPNQPSRPSSVSPDTLRDVIETLAEIHRPACSPGEREAAEWIAERLQKADCSDVIVDEETSRGAFPPTLTALGVLGTLGAVKVMFGRKRGALLSAAALAGLVDEIQNGPRVLRRNLRAARTTTNVVATIGASGAPRTLVVLAHHDAAQTGKVFDQTWAKSLYRLAPGLMRRQKKQLPQWWIGVAPPILSAISAITGWKRPARWGFALSVVGLAAMADIMRSPTVPGANDNLSGVAVLIGLAEALRDKPVDGLRVVLASCGAEETLQDGVRAFMSRHGREFDHSGTYFLNFDTVGSTELAMLEGEGPVWMEHYADPSFRDLVDRAATESGVTLERGFKARASTDSVIPSRAGYPTATIVSVMPWRLPGNYHLMSDTAENVDYGTVMDSVHLARAVAGALGSAAR
jgi:hypothetical protein